MASERIRHNLKDRWLEFWFAPAAARPLALCRIAFYGLLFVYYLTYDFGVWALAPADSWAPTPPFLIFDVPRASHELLVLLQFAWKAALLCACLGLATRAATAASFGLGLYLIGVMRSVSMNHTDAALILVLGIMAVARCSDACALDRWLIGRTRLQASRPSGDYRWPVQLIQIATILPLFVAGISKLRHAGLEWVFSDTLAIVLLQNHFRTDPLLPWGVELARYGWLCQLLAAGALITELALPLALVSVRARLLLIPGALGLLLGFRLFLGPNFAPLMICYVFWLPWRQITDTLMHQIRTRPGLAALCPAHLRPALAPAQSRHTRPR
ncbi:MAG: hypothetical protein U0841_03770 [Chloroflexia bacterium]